MFDSGTLQLLDGGTEIAYFGGLDEASLDQHLRTLSAARARIDAVETNVLVAISRLHTAGSPGAKPADTADNLTEGTGESRTQARRKARRAELVDHHPIVSHALAGGLISAGHADALSAIPEALSEALLADLPDLLERAASQSVDQFADTIRRWKERQALRSGDDHHKSRHDQRSFRLRRDRHIGMSRVGGLLDAETAAKVETLLGRIEQQMLREDQQSAAEDPDFKLRTSSQRRADALARIFDLALGAESDGCRAAEPTVVVTIQLSDLISGLGDGEALRGGVVSAETARRMACEGGIIPAVLGSSGQVLDLGRRTRLATAAQRLALEARYGGCAVPSCDAPFHWCHAHHIDHWESGGPTDLSNLIPICTRHHRQVHDGRLQIQRDRSGTDIWSRPKSEPHDETTRRRSCAAARPPADTRTPLRSSQSIPGRQQTLAV